MLYQILDSQTQPDGSLKITVTLHAEHAIFRGHFPGNPVLPGACMVQILKELLQQVQHRELTLHKAANIKFLSVIVPQENQPLVFHLQTKTTADELLSVNATLYTGEVASMKFSGTYITALC